MKIAASTILLSCLLATAAPAADTAAPVIYRLVEQSLFEAGCLDPCMCPVLVRKPLAGTFTLVPAGQDDAYDLYEVRDVSWKLEGDPPVAITGGGSYRVGRAVEGRTQQLVLDLSAGGAPAGRYDSGIVADGGFPLISLPIALHGFFCHDSVYGVQAEPRVTAVHATAPGGLDLRASPNPFGSRAEITFSLSARARVTLRVYDLSGREVRTLVRGRHEEPGVHVMTWDGRGADGRQVPSGIYFVGLDVAGREIRGKLVKL